MKQQIANYTVIIKQEKRTGTDAPCFTAYVPTLGIATDADTLDGVQREIKSLVKFHLESLKSEGEEIPVEGDHPLVTRFTTPLPKGAMTAVV